MLKGDQFEAPRFFRFDNFELRPDESSLFQKGRRLKLQPQPFRVLAFLISRSPSVVAKEEVGRQIWGPGVHVDLDQSLNYCIRQIRQVLDDSATQPRYVETLPRQGYRFICPVVVVQNLSQALPSTIPTPTAPVETSPTKNLLAAADAPAGMPSVSPVQHVGDLVPLPPLGRAGRPRKLGWLLAASILLIASLGGVSWFALSRGSLRIERLAVLPLENLSGDPGQEYLADGMTEELTTKLAKDSTLRVVSRTSAMQYKGARRPLREIAKALGADAVIEGSLAREGTRMHITLQLIRAETDSHLWAESYDRDANDASVSDQAARSIALRLRSAAPSLHSARYIAPAAHEAYLRGRYLWPTYRMMESGAYFQKATEIQPDYAEAWAGLSNFYGEGIAGDVLDPRINMRLEEEAARRAVALAPQLALSHQAMSGMYLIDHWDFKNADREILQAIQIDPNDAASLYLRANVLEAMNRFPEAIEVEKRSMEMDPFERRSALAEIYVIARRFDEALTDLNLRLETAPNDPFLLSNAAQAWRCKGNYKEAVASWVKLYNVIGDPQAGTALRRAFELGGPHGLVRWQLKQRLHQAKDQYVSPVELASYYAQLGDEEHTLQLLQEGYQQRSTDMLWIADDPAYDFLHGNSRYQAIRRAVTETASF